MFSDGMHNLNLRIIFKTDSLGFKETYRSKWRVQGTYISTHYPMTMELVGRDCNTHLSIPHLITDRDVPSVGTHNKEIVTPSEGENSSENDFYTSVLCNFSKTRIPLPSELVKPSLTPDSTPFYVVTQGCEVGIFEAYQIAHLPVGTFTRLAFECFHLWQDSITYYNQEFEDGNIQLNGSSFIHGAALVEAHHKKYDTTILRSLGSAEGCTKVIRQRELIPASVVASTRNHKSQIIVHGESDDTDLVPGPRYPKRGEIYNPEFHRKAQIIVHGESDDTDLIPGPRYPGFKRRSKQPKSIRGTRRSSQPFIAPAASDNDMTSSPTPFIANDSHTLTPPAPSSPVARYEDSDYLLHPESDVAEPAIELPTTPVRNSNHLRSIVYPEGYDSDEAITEAQLHAASLRRLSVIAAALTVEPPMTPLAVTSGSPFFSDDVTTTPAATLETGDMRAAGLATGMTPLSQTESEDMFADFSEYDAEIYDQLYARFEPKSEAASP